MYRWIEHEDGSEDVAEDEDTPCGTLPPAKASMCTICGMCTLYMYVYNTCVRICVQYKYTIHVYNMSNSSTVQGKHPQSSAPVLNIFGQHFISIFTSLCLFEEHSSQKLLNKFSWKLRICMILTHLTNALFTTKESVHIIDSPKFSIENLMKQILSDNWHRIPKR